MLSRLSVSRGFRSSFRQCALSTSAPASTHVPSWSTIDPSTAGLTSPMIPTMNLVNGEWTSAASRSMVIPDPLRASKEGLATVPLVQSDELGPFINSLKSVPKTGLHNPLKNVDRYVALGDISSKAGDALADPEIQDYFAKCIQRCMPKSYAQCRAEVAVTAAFLKNFSSDNVRFLCGNDFGVTGDYDGQVSRGYRWPYGPVCIIAPFNFPLEIPVLQLMGALFMGNKPVLKPAEKVSFVMEQFIRLLVDCGMDPKDVDLLNCEGPVVGELIEKGGVRVTQFTGSSRVAELLSEQTRGKVKIEDAGFDWKILGPDVGDVDYVAWQCDQDAYAASGQKCSAQSILFAHDNWMEAGIVDKVGDLANNRKLDDLTVGPIMTHTTADMKRHIDDLLTIPGAKILWGGKELDDHDIPDCYGAMEPTAVFVPLKEMMKPENFDRATTEFFGPFQVVTSYADEDIDTVLEALERMSHHLTAAVVSNDVSFQHKVLGNSVNGTTYTGRRARTTGAPQNHWFGPAGDPRGCGIGSKEAIKMVWSCHREIVSDSLVPEGWTRPPPT